MSPSKTKINFDAAEFASDEPLDRSDVGDDADDASSVRHDAGERWWDDPAAAAAKSDRFAAFLADLDGAKAHFRESQRHLLLGISETARAAQRQLIELPDQQWVRLGEGAATLVYSVLELAAARIEPMHAMGGQDVRLNARLEALANLRAFLSAEKSRYETQSESHKAEAARAIISAITAEMERLANHAVAASSATTASASASSIDEATPAAAAPTASGAAQTPTPRRRKSSTEKINIRTSSESHS